MVHVVHKNLIFTLKQTVVFLKEFMWLKCGCCMTSDKSLNHINMVVTP